MSTKVKVSKLNQRNTYNEKQTNLNPAEILEATDLIEKILSSAEGKGQAHREPLNSQSVFNFVKENTLNFNNLPKISKKQAGEQSQYQINFREQLQSPFVKNLPSPTDFNKFSRFIHENPAGKNIYVELNGPGQIDPKNQNYSRSLIDSIIQSGGIAGLHLGAKVGFLEKALPTILSFSEREKSSIILKFFVRIEKYDPAEIIRIFDLLENHGFPRQNIRVGIEHIFSLIYTGLENLDSREKPWSLIKALNIYQDLLQILKENNIARISIPETRGVAANEKIVKKTTYLLLNMARKAGVNPISCELHFHDDFEVADRNTLAAAQTILAFNKLHGTQTKPIIDTTVLGGERSGIAGEKTLSKAFGAKFYIQTRSLLCKILDVDVDNAVFTPNSQLLRRHTAGTHIDLVWNKIVEISQKVCDRELTGGVTQIVKSMQSRQLQLSPSTERSLSREKQILLKKIINDKGSLLAAAFLLVYGESIRIKASENKKNLQKWNLEPIVEITTPVQGKKNLVTRLIIDGHDVTDNSERNYRRIRDCLADIVDNFNEIDNDFTDLEDLLQNFSEKYKNSAGTSKKI